MKFEKVTIKCNIENHVDMQPTVFYCCVKFCENSAKLNQNLAEINFVD